MARVLCGWPSLTVLFIGATVYFFGSLLSLASEPSQEGSYASLARMAANDSGSVYYLPAGVRMPPPPLGIGVSYALYIWVEDCASCSVALSTCLSIGEGKEQVKTIVVVRDRDMRKGLFADYPDALVMSERQASGDRLIVPSPGVMVVSDAQGVVQFSTSDPKEAAKWLEARI